MSVKDVADRFGTTIWTMYDLRLGRTYKHLRRPSGLPGVAGSRMPSQ